MGERSQSQARSPRKLTYGRDRLLALPTEDVRPTCWLWALQARSSDGLASLRPQTVAPFPGPDLRPKRQPVASTRKLADNNSRASFVLPDRFVNEDYEGAALDLDAKTPALRVACHLRSARGTGRVGSSVNREDECQFRTILWYPEHRLR
jgi:hypothetical protein